MSSIQIFNETILINATYLINNTNNSNNNIISDDTDNKPNLNRILPLIIVGSIIGFFIGCILIIHTFQGLHYLFGDYIKYLILNIIKHLKNPWVFLNINFYINLLQNCFYIKFFYYCFDYLLIIKAKGWSCKDIIKPSF